MRKGRINHQETQVRRLREIGRILGKGGFE